jgi:site-specific recombinase XerD
VSITAPADAILSLSEAAQSFRRHLRAENKSPATITIYLTALRRLDRFLEQLGMPRELSSVRREHIEAFLVDLQESAPSRPR